MIWEKWMHQSGKEYDKQHWQNWWDETRKLGGEAGIHTVHVPPVPEEWGKNIYSTADELLCEIKELLGVPTQGAIRLELSVGSVEEAIQAKEKISIMREGLRTIDDDAAWMIARVREATFGDQIVCQLYEDNEGRRWCGLHLQHEQFGILKIVIVRFYSEVRTIVKNLKNQMKDFVRQVDEVYKK